MANKYLKAGLVLGLLCLTAKAQETAQEKIISANERMAVLRAKHAELEVEAQIAAKKAEIRKIKGEDRFEAKGGASMPTVKAIEGIDSHKMATISYPSGEEETVRVGDTLKSGWKVTSMDIRTVSLVRKREKVRLYASSGSRVGTLGQVVPGEKQSIRHEVRSGTGDVPNIPIIPGN